METPPLPGVADRGVVSPDQGGPAVVLIGSRIAGTAPAAVWLTAAGWAEAGRRRCGDVLMVTSDGPMDPAVARRTATMPRQLNGASSSTRRRRVATVRDFAKDLRELVRAITFAARACHAVPRRTSAAVVWQHHEPWQWSGWLIARRSHAPWVLFVDAPVVWESRAWGVRRPGWGRLLERWGEVPQFRRADVIACVSETVAEEVRRLGAPRDRVVVTPCSVDASDFAPAPEQARGMREELGLEGRVVVGWLGSFRRFHGMDLLLDAYEAARTEQPELALLLVGDGTERSRVEEDVRRRGLSDVVMTGMVQHDKIPRYLAAMDIGVVIDPGTAQWHYSPLKLQEYMACGLAVVAPRSGDVEAALRDREDALLVPPGDTDALATCLRELARDPALRTRLGTAARARSEADGGWDHQLRSVMELAAMRRG